MILSILGLQLKIFLAIPHTTVAQEVAELLKQAYPLTASIALEQLRFARYRIKANRSY